MSLTLISELSIPEMGADLEQLGKHASAQQGHTLPFKNFS
jgi:hypothetical protein